MYERAGSLNVIRAPGAGASRRSGRTRRGCSKVLNALQVRTGQRLAGQHARGGRVAPFELELPFAVQIAIQHQHTRLAVLRIVRRDHVHERHLFVAAEVGLQPRGGDRIRLRFHPQVEHLAARVLQGPRVRVVNALPEHAGIVRDERRDDVDELREAADADAIRRSAAAC